jgi:hypothetical protein
MGFFGAHGLVISMSAYFMQDPKQTKGLLWRKFSSGMFKGFLCWRKKTKSNQVEGMG